ncbi:hypothetical protein FACS189463_0220 [Bacteroidia bacterium]|nr:hypothetical protein FACS189463_0220 [Bacteroidia bacterium]
MSILDKKYWFDGDTIINSKRYTKVYQQYCYSETEYGDLDYFAAVREDTIGEKIYCIQQEDGVERLLADFDVNVGDEIKVYTYENECPVCEVTVWVRNIDFIQFANQSRKRITVANHPTLGDVTWDSWVEGIGSIERGLFFSMDEGLPDRRDRFVFLCLHENDQLIYQNPDYNVCYLKDNGVWDPDQLFQECVENQMQLTGKSQEECEFYCRYWYWQSIPENNPLDIKLYPSFVEDILFVESSDLIHYYQIYNNQGVKIEAGFLNNAKINVSILTSGLYYIMLYDRKDKCVWMDKFIKK